MAFDTKWILIVDDDDDIRDSLRELLKITFGDDELKIVEARNGLEATTKINNQKFDCIITDLKMPKKEGDALIPSIRQNVFNENTPILVLTGYPSDRLAIDYRFTYLLEKPYKHSELIDLISTQLKLANDDERLAADMVNCLISAVQLFLSKAFAEEKVQISSPIAKKYGESFDVDYVSQVSIVDQGMRNTFSLLLNEADVEKLATAFSGIANKDLETIGFALGKTVLNHAMSGVNKKSALNFNIKNLNKEEAAIDLKKKRGIIIPIESAGIKINVLACGEKK